jgi:DNA-binding response OmpR family regulator
MFLLEHLAQQPNRLIGVQELFTVTHGGQAVEKREAGHLMRPLICTLRRKLKYYLGEPDCIKNVRGHGYIFVVG